MSDPFTGPVSNQLQIGSPKSIVTIDLQTGAVTLGEGIVMDEASKAFWDAVRQVAAVPCPKCREVW